VVPHLVRTSANVHTDVQQTDSGILFPASQASPASTTPFPQTARTAPDWKAGGGGTITDDAPPIDNVLEGVCESLTEEDIEGGLAD